MIPNGNCRDCSQSRRVIHEHELIAPGDNHIVRELILYHNFRDNLRDEGSFGFSQSPIHYVLQSPLLENLSFNLSDHFGGKVVAMNNAHGLLIRANNQSVAGNSEFAPPVRSKPCSKPCFYLRPLLGNDAEANRITDATVGHDYMLAKYAFLLSS